MRCALANALYQFKGFKSTLVWLYNKGLDLTEVRLTLDDVFKNYLRMKHDLAQDAAMEHDKPFETAVN